MTCHAVMPAENPLCRQLFVVAVDRSDRIAPIRICGFGGGCGDLILAVVGALLFVDQGPLDVDELDLLLEAIGIGTDLTQLLALEVAHETEGGNAVVVAAVVFLLQRDLHQAAIGGTPPVDKGSVQKLFERLDAGGRERDQQRHILAAAQQVDVPHILARLAPSAVSGRAILVHRASGAGAARFTNSRLAVHRGTERLGVLVILTAFRPEGAGGVIIENHALQRPGIVRIVRVLGGDLELQLAAGGNLHPLETHHLQTVGILRDLLAAEVALYHGGKQESLSVKLILKK